MLTVVNMMRDLTTAALKAEVRAGAEAEVEAEAREEKQGERRITRIIF